MTFKRSMFSTLAGASLAVAALVSSPATASDAEVVMYKDPYCGCCGKWAQHMRDNGFKVKEVVSSEMNAIKLRAGIPRQLSSCHTARVGNYYIEGHVPADDVRRMLREKPQITGISAPGMPLGSPGMEGPYPPDRYQVISFGGRQGHQVFAEH